MFRSLVVMSCLLTLAGHAVAQEEKVEVGKPAPDFTVTGIDGKTFKLSDKTGRGKNIVLMFDRAHW